MQRLHEARTIAATDARNQSLALRAAAIRFKSFCGLLGAERSRQQGTAGRENTKHSGACPVITRLAMLL